jgi:chromosome segregation protein
MEPLGAQREEQARGVAQLEGRVAELERELDARRQELAEVEREARQREQRAASRQQARTRVERELRGHRAHLDRLDQELMEAREVISRLVSQQAVAEERARQFESRRQEALAQLEPLQTQEEEQAQRVARERARLAELEQQLAARRAALAELKQQAGGAEPGAEGRAEQRAAVEQALRDHRARVARLEGSLREARDEAAGLAGELKALERMQASGAAYDRGVQILLEADVDGVIGPLATMIRVPPSWERAIEAALGSDLQAVVVERTSTVQRIDQLLEAQGGRVTLLPLDLRPGSAGSEGMPQGLPKGALSAAGLVGCEEEIRPVVDALLGTVALCEGLEEARALLPGMPPGGRCVTRGGVVLRADGAVVVGRAEAGGLLADERTRRELPAQLERVRQHLQQAEAQRQAEAERVASLEARLEEIDRQAAQAREEARRRFQERLGDARTAVAVAEETLRSQRAALERAEAELARLQGQRDTLRQQASELDARHAAQMEQARAFRLAVSQMERGDAGEEAQEGQPAPATQSPRRDPEAERFRERLWEAYRRCDAIETQQRAASEQVASLQERLERLTQQAAAAQEEAARFEREQLSTARTGVAVTEASLRSQQQALEREAALLERLRSQIDARRERAEELRAERERLLERIDTLRQEASRLGATLHQVRERIQPAEDELEALDEAAAALLQRRQRADKRVRAAEERHGRAELEVERKRDELRLLGERIEEDLGLVELELAESVTAQTPLPMRPLVSELPVVELLPKGLEGEMQFVKKRLRRLGAVNPNAPRELAEVEERHTFLTEQAADLREATEQLRHTVSELDTMMEHAFSETFHAVAERFSDLFSDLFEGGEADLTLTEPDDLLNTGVEIMARPPGKRAQRLALLSGGERALTAVALLFSLLHISPTPFCVLDEVDAMLDEANVGRFRAKLEDLAQGTQFIIITHNRATVESAHAVYGVSMGSNAVSRVVSLKLEEDAEGRAVPA